MRSTRCYFFRCWWWWCSVFRSIRTRKSRGEIAGGLIWVAFLFAAVVALNQTWARELRNQVLDAYRVSPAPANARCLSQGIGEFYFGERAGSGDGAVVHDFLQSAGIGPAWQLIPVAMLGTWALVVNGTFFAAMSLRTRSREIMLPLLLFPISIPAVQSMVEATRIILAGDGFRRASGSCCFSPTMWCLLLLVWRCLKRFCRRNGNERLPHPRGSYGSAAGLRFL